MNLSLLAQNINDVLDRARENGHDYLISTDDAVALRNVADELEAALAQQAQPFCDHTCDKRNGNHSDACEARYQAQSEMPTLREKFENELHERNAGHAGRDWLVSIGSALEAFDALFAPKETTCDCLHKITLMPPHARGCPAYSQCTIPWEVLDEILNEDSVQHDYRMKPRILAELRKRGYSQ